ncbi:hypothetical protein TARUN_4817 [Trichoderma arundinaceum]|uniref:Dihydrodipicolinate synthase n=1 Tax=Trichoderma arundinaceum TaxID=490622 RepID=A0A395NMU8_TRIAR|nr:hypothetical protein TARUN_4817 [Trichoderma arundinaceum]
MSNGHDALTQRQDVNSESSTSGNQLIVSPSMDRSPTVSGLRTLQAMDEVFDYASFMWDPSSSLWQQESPDIASTIAVNANVMIKRQKEIPITDEALQEPSTFMNRHSDSLVVNTYSDATTIQENEEQALDQDTSNASERLMEFFAKSATPPILAGVESQRKWFSIRQGLVAMSKSSRVLRCAILAFSNTLLCRSNLSWAFADQNHYQEAAVEVEAQDPDSLNEHSLARECLLAALFFLSYVGILETRLDTAHRYLKQAYTIFQRGDKASFSHVEKQVLLWIRLLDARAVSAGGEGLFLSQDDEIELVEASPASFDAETDEIAGSQDASSEDIEDVLFQVLYQPGIVFFQKVQSFMGRISKIDPWHRSRGTVEDEIEVMNIGASIAADLRSLYDQRPPLMDYAVAGKLSEPHISAHLAFTITRAFRTYLSNYYASKVHLHRVAYKHLPLTKEATDALSHIRKLAHQISSDLAPDDSLPVNMLWPLLMLGVEEHDQEEKAWIKAQIVRMEGVAGNARITAQVLEEVQARQEATKARADIRDNGSQDIDWDLQERHLNFLITSGLHGVVLAGTNGEAVTLTQDEKNKLVAMTRRIAAQVGKPDITITLGCSGQCTRDVIAETKLAKEAGADYVLLLVPSYFHFAMNKNSIIAFFEETADASPLPILIYNYPNVVAGLDVDSEMLDRLAKHTNIVGVKLTCGGIAKVSRIAASFSPKNFSALAGQSDWLVPALSVGGTGAITGIANLYPKLELSKMEWGFAKGGINGTKWVVAKLRGYPEESCHCRRPYPKFDNSVQQEWIIDVVGALEVVEKGIGKDAR